MELCWIWEGGCKTQDISAWVQAIASVVAIVWVNYSTKKQSATQYKTAMDQVAIQHKNSLELFELQQKHSLDQTKKIYIDSIELERYRLNTIKLHRLRIVGVILSKLDVTLEEINSKLKDNDWDSHAASILLESAMKEISVIPLFDIPDPELAVSFTSLPTLLMQVKVDLEQAQEMLLHHYKSKRNNTANIPTNRTTEEVKKEIADGLKANFHSLKEVYALAATRCIACVKSIRIELEENHRIEKQA